MLEKERSAGVYTSDSESSSTGGYRSSVYIETNGSGTVGPKKVGREKCGGDISDSEAQASTETNVIDGPKKVCIEGREIAKHC